MSVTYVVEFERWDGSLTQHTFTDREALERFFHEHYEDGNINIIDTQYSPDHPVYVTVYGRRLCYGGPEEGGWWYPHDEVVESHQVPFRDAHRLLAEKKAEIENRKRRPFTSVLGGYMEWVTIEDVQGYHETKRRPRYE